jgi:hypothetical protein
LSVIPEPLDLRTPPEHLDHVRVRGPWPRRSAGARRWRGCRQLEKPGIAIGGPHVIIEHVRR